MQSIWLMVKTKIRQNYLSLERHENAIYLTGKHEELNQSLDYY